MAERAAGSFHLGYRPALDGIRAVAVLMVMLEHFGLPGLPGGFLGVDVFFVLSGFLITTLLLEEREATGGIRLDNFYARRALRLFPAVFTLLLCALPFVPIGFVLCAAFYVANWPIAVGWVRSSPISHLWSLGVEEQFYLVWPVTLAILLRLGASRRVVLAGVATLAAASAAFKVLAWRSPASWVRLFHGTDGRADALFVGCLLGLAMVWRLLPETRAFRLAARIAAVPAIVCLGALSATQTAQSSFLYRGGGLTLVALSVGVLLLQTLIAPARAVSAVLESGPMVGIGRISYGLYLWHHPIAWISLPWLLGVESPVPTFLLRMALSFAAAGICYAVIERPLLRMKRRFSGSRG